MLDSACSVQVLILLVLILTSLPGINGSRAFAVEACNVLKSKDISGKNKRMFFQTKNRHLNKMMFGRRIALRCCGGFEFDPIPSNHVSLSLACRAPRLAMQSEKRSILLASPTR